MLCQPLKCIFLIFFIIDTRGPTPYTTIVDNTFLQGRITATKALIVIYEGAITAIVTNGAQSYTLDTGQSRQVVTKVDIAQLNASLDGLYNRLCTLQARLDGSGVMIVRPGW